MAETVISDAARFPQDDGYPNISDGNESWGSAGHLGLLATATAHGPFIYDGLVFSGHDATNDTVDVQAGVAVLDLSEDSSTFDVQSATGGSSAPAYDTTLSAPGAIVVAAPTATTVSVVDTQTNPIWIAYATDGAVTGVAAGDVYLRHENGGGVSAPPHPNVKLGEANPDDSTADVRAGYDNPPNAEGWREDPNSPWSSSSVSSATQTFTLAGRYDEVRVEFTTFSTFSDTLSFGCHINGDTSSSYITYDADSNELGGRTDWRNVLATYVDAKNPTKKHWASARWTLRGDWPPDSGNGSGYPSLHMERTAILNSGGGVDTMISGRYNANLAPPLESVSIVENSSETSWGYEVTISGRHITEGPTN
jgi:hypothetical protein